MKRPNDVTDLERAERLLALRTASLERLLPADGNDPVPGELGSTKPTGARWTQYCAVVSALTQVRAYLHGARSR